MSTPVVSVIIPVFNAQSYIADTIQSVLNQTWNNLEIIIINDGSTDDSEKIIHTFLHDFRIKYIFQKNQGSATARNVGLSAATGDYIQYLDADDIISNNKIESQVIALSDKSPFDIAICKTRIFHTNLGDNNEEISSQFLYSTSKPIDFILNLYGLNGEDGMIQPNAFLISRHLAMAVGQWDLSIAPSPDDDGEYFCRVMLQATGIHLTDGINYYRKQISSKKSLSNQHDYLHSKGKLGALILKTNHLLEIENSERVKYTMAKQFANFMYMYDGKFKDLSDEAETYIHKMGLKKVPVAGGNNFKRMAHVIGFKQALKIKKIFGN